mmetsp:Transcript_104763/g.165393  ORF Transcript_104763/g.165393 Transcript_104763/m.165393 type:complete len:206 (+) Transcript_104763:289-906(+)
MISRGFLVLPVQYALVRPSAKRQEVLCKRTLPVQMRQVAGTVLPRESQVKRKRCGRQTLTSYRGEVVQCLETWSCSRRLSGSPTLLLVFCATGLFRCSSDVITAAVVGIVCARIARHFECTLTRSFNALLQVMVARLLFQSPLQLILPTLCLGRLHIVFVRNATVLVWVYSLVEAIRKPFWFWILFPNSLLSIVCELALLQVLLE